MAYLLILFWNLAALLPIGLGWWGVFPVLGLYWFENACTGWFQYRRMSDLERARPDPRQPFPMSRFFAMHYGIFTSVHGILVLAFFGLASGGFREAANGWWLSAAVVVFLQWQGYREWQRADGAMRSSSGRLMAEPYARVLVLHVIVLVGGFLALSAAEPRNILMLFAALKLAVELAANALWSRFAGDAAAQRR
ncbi:MAG: hypothetical protein IT478_12420 [Xanthomonadales bacterium]|nr:hypothetical protein [Xanthomonadales bacterium]